MIVKDRLHNNYDFLRIFAALCVTFSHSFDLLNKPETELLSNLTGGRIEFSFIGLSIFFSISGYLVAKSAINSTSFKNYLWKRFLRIQPMLVVLCILSVFIIGVAFSSIPVKEYFLQVESWTYFRNILPLLGIQFTLPGVFHNNIHPLEINGSLWTLVLEERLYLLLALLLFFKKPPKNTFILFIIILNIIYILNNYNVFHINFPSLLGVYPLMFLNASAFYFLKIDFFKRRHLFLVLSFGVSFLSVFYKELSLLQVFTIPFLVLSFAVIKSITNNAGKFGDFTFGIYIFSFPVQQIFISKKIFLDTPYQLFFATLLIVVPMAIVSWHLVEKRMLALKNKIQ
jgi:peptidoglycan/LPS O-acetylase OafA/YrhL